LPKRKHNGGSDEVAETSGAPVRSMWSGTITFGLVSIPVDLLSAVRPRQTAMKLVDKSGHALGREYHCSKEDKELSKDELVRGYETDEGKMVVITDEEFESVAPEMSGDIELRGALRQHRQGVQPACHHDGENRTRRHRQLRDARPRVPGRNRR
jgi:DNA end-binding protein Ku